ncbi:hypothetical protein P7H06_10980 [Paenibacillus larvae]|nr:hypothetical protein [Paenibacillus larvae]MDT2259947.1 hypothetical protein [Paenibacillus larvae]
MKGWWRYDNRIRPDNGVRLEGPDYVLCIIGIIVGGEFKQVGKNCGYATELEAKANKITKSMVTEIKGTGKRFNKVWMKFWKKLNRGEQPKGKLFSSKKMVDSIKLLTILTVWECPM